MQVEFFVPGDAVPQPRPRARAIKRNGTYTAQIYTPNLVGVNGKKTSVADFKEIVATIAKQQICGQKPTSGSPLSVYMCFQLRRPKNHWSQSKKIPRAIRNKFAGALPIVKPDVDNLSKSVLDAMNGVVYHDDSQVTKLILLKRYVGLDDEPGIYVSVQFDQITAQR